MNNEILINVTPQETRVAIIQRGVAQELHIEREAHRGLVGNIYNGVVKRILPGMQSAFIDIGMEKAAFLHVADIFSDDRDNLNQMPIENLLREGQTLLVQVVKDPIGTKGARLSTQISVAGRLLVYLPFENHIGISQKIGNEEEREHLKERLTRLKGENCQQGFIVRTLAETASDSDFESDIEYLRRVWGDVKIRAETCKAPSPVYQDLDLSVRVLRDFLYSIFSKLLVVVLLGMAVVIFFGGPLIELLSDEIILTDIGPFLWILPVFIFLLFCNLPISLLIIALDMKKMYFGYHLIGLITALVLLPFLISFFDIVKGGEIRSAFFSQRSQKSRRPLSIHFKTT